jgi:anti-sigma regulatory factor (Ser/Thr protein kinase)
MTLPRISDPATIGLTLRLPATPAAPQLARAFITDTVASWHVKQDHIDDAVLITSELVTNALAATGRTTGPPNPAPGETPAPITIAIRLDRSTIILAVHDTSTVPPKLTNESDDAENGRGLHIVNALTSQWGHYHPTHGGKTIWCHINTT